MTDDHEYRRKNDARISELSDDVYALKSGIAELHEDIRGVVGMVQITQDWVKDSAKVGRDVKGLIDCPDDSTLCKHAELSASSAVKKVFAVFGVDIDKPSEVIEFQMDLRFGRSLRNKWGKSTFAVWILVLGIVTSGMVALLVEGFRTKVGG